MIDSLIEFLTLLKDWFFSWIDGLSNLVASLGFVLSLQFNVTWMPVVMMTIMGTCAVILVLFRIIGR